MIQIKAISIRLQQLHSNFPSSFSKDLLIYNCLAVLRYIIFFYLYSNLSVILLFNYRQYYSSFQSFLCYVLLLQLDYFLSKSKSQTDRNILELDFKATDLFREESIFLLFSSFISTSQIGDQVFLKVAFYYFFSSFYFLETRVIGIILFLIPYLSIFSSCKSIDQFDICSSSAQLISNLALISQFLMSLIVSKAFSPTFMIPFGGLIKKQLVCVTLIYRICSLYLEYQGILRCILHIYELHSVVLLENYIFE